MYAAHDIKLKLSNKRPSSETQTSQKTSNKPSSGTAIDPQQIIKRSKLSTDESFLLRRVDDENDMDVIVEPVITTVQVLNPKNNNKERNHKKILQKQTDFKALSTHHTSDSEYCSTIFDSLTLSPGSSGAEGDIESLASVDIL